jgi:hypothetical protein
MVAINFTSPQTEEYAPRCHQIIKDNHDWCCEVTGKLVEKPCLFDDIVEQVPAGSFDPRESFNKKAADLALAWIQGNQFCHTHTCLCPLVNLQRVADYDFSGLPCNDNSKNGLQAYQEGPTGPIFIIWGEKHKRLGTRLLILENTPALRLQ